MALLAFIQPNFMKYGYMYWVDYHQYNNHKIALRELVDKKHNRGTEVNQHVQVGGVKTALFG
jgi:hypothetical protein